METKKTKKNANKQGALNEIDFLQEDINLSGSFPLKIDTNLFVQPQKIPAKKPGNRNKIPVFANPQIQNDWLSFDSKHLEKTMERQKREAAMKMTVNDEKWHEIEKEMFYRYFLYNQGEYISGIRTLARLYRKHHNDSKWNDICPSALDWVECKWKKIFYEYKPPKQENQEALSEFTCRRCKKKGTVSVRREQIKSKDEGETVFYTCEDPKCGVTWKE